MTRLVLLLVLAVVAWQAFDRISHNRAVRAATLAAQAEDSRAATPPPRPASRAGVTAPAAGSAFRCDGRTHCSQMASCAEATYFLRNCPGVKMDGNNDGVPCEKQWCGR